jgi:RNA polymerase sigma-70 factor (ECF subfamily)
MSSSNHDDHLSRITTMWTMVRQAHGENSSEINAAQDRIIERYSGAVYRYLLAVLRDKDAADEVFQEFALRLVRGGFRKADQQRGRFRDYVKVAVLRLVTDYHRKRQRDARRGTDNDELVELAEDAASPDPKSEQAFVASCRDEFLGRAWRGLKAIEEQSGQLLFTILDYRARHPDTPSQQMADELNRTLEPEKPITAAGVRKTLERARLRFADLLLEEVAQSLDEPDGAEVEQELIDLGLHAYCANALSRRQNGTGRGK